MATNIKKPELTDANNSLANEIVGIVLLAVGLLLALALVTFNAADPSFNTASRESISNFVGTTGANLAAALLQTFGLAAYVLPILIWVAAWRAFWAKSLTVSIVRVTGFVLLVVAVSALLPLFGFGLFFDRSVPAGGVIGLVVARVLSAGLGTIGSIVLLVAVCAAAFLLVSNVSYQPIIEQFQHFIGYLKNKLSEWREYERQQARMRLEKRRDAKLNSLLAAERSKNKISEIESNAKSKLESATAEARTSNAFARIAHSFSTRLKNFFERIKQPPDFARDGDEAANKKPAASNDFGEPDESENAELPNDFRQKIEIQPRRKEQNGKPKTNGDFDRNGFESEDSENVFARAHIDSNDFDVEDYDADIPIQPLKTGDAITELFDSDDGDLTDAEDAENPKSKIQNPKSSVSLDDYKLPSTEFLNQAPAHIQHQNSELLDIAHTLTDKCKEFKANGSVVNICPGPVATTYEYKLDAGVKFTTISGLVDDLCLGLQAESVRIDRIPGKAFVGIEVPNPRRETIYLREVLESRSFNESKSLLSIALGKTADGLNYSADLAKMPHLLVAGATGAGKSVGVNGLIVSILYKARPDEVKFIMIDPKQVELNLYADIPHLATPIITDPKRAAIALKWAVVEMERRYKMLSAWYTRNIDGYNAEVARRNAVGELDENGESYKTLPYIVIIVDEFADLMMVARGEVEESITRLAQKARAVGVHLVLATQRPSVDVVTGLIKANFPCRIAFRVSSSIDSKTIIGGGGAEHLLGRGDMLFLPPGTSRLVRVHGAFVDESEIQKIVEHIKAQSAPEYDTTITQTEEELSGDDFIEDDQDDLFADALKICVEMKRASTSVLQRRLSIGYGRAAKIIDAMERAGYVGASEGASKPRAILDKAYERVSEWSEQGL